MAERLRLTDVCVNFDQRPILKSVGLRVAAGEVLAVIGPNGAGKTTLIRAISGALPVRHGKITVGGQPVEKMAPRKRARLLGVVPQARHLPPAFTVRQTVMLGRTPYLPWSGNPSAQDRRSVEQAMASAELLKLADRRIETLSGGEQQRVLLARALAQQPRLLLLDEPTTFLDLQYQASFLSLVRRLAHRQGLGVLMALHDLNQVSIVADRVVLLVSGESLAQGTPAEVLTPERIATAYQAPVEVIPHPTRDMPLVLPRIEE